jgi:hypothetical protein
MKTINKLPELWSIKITENNLEVLNDWRTVKGSLQSIHINAYLLNSYSFHTGFYVAKSSFSKYKNQYPLIEYEDFEKFVLFKDSKINMKYLIKLFKKYNIK